MERTKREEEFRQQYEESERYNLTTVDDNNAGCERIDIYIVLHADMISDLFQCGKETFRNRYSRQSQ